MRSYVDPIVNVAVISQIDLRRDLAALLKLDFPERFLPTFLHEGTHHACFMSPLGTALALLRMRAYRRATHLRTRPHADHWGLLEDVLRQEATMELLRPFAEGLACFSELDSNPGHSNVLTTPMLSTFYNFGGFDEHRGEEYVRREHGANLYIFSLLYPARLHADLAQRRENVLAGRFPMRFGGHLPGYMAFKNIWNSARRQTYRANDTELFGAYMRAYFYEDYGFVATLLDDTKREFTAVGAIGDYFLQRLKQLLKPDWDWDAALEQFERGFGATAAAMRGTTKLVHASPLGLSNDPEVCQHGMADLETLVCELLEMDDTDIVQAAMRNFDLLRLSKRQLLCLGSLDAKVGVNGSGRVSVWPEDSGLPEGVPTINAPAIEGVREGRGDGSFEFYLLPNDHARASAIVRGNEVVHVNFEGDLSGARKAELTSLFGSRTKDLKIIEEQEGNLEFVIARDSIAVLRNRAKTESPERIETIYRWLATFPIEDDRWKDAAEKLSRGGLFELCGKDSDFIRGLSLLGVVSSVNPGRKEIAEIANERGFDLEDLLRKATKLETATGFATLREVDGKIRVMV